MGASTEGARECLAETWTELNEMPLSQGSVYNSAQDIQGSKRNQIQKCQESSDYNPSPDNYNKEIVEEAKEPKDTTEILECASVIVEKKPHQYKYLGDTMNNMRHGVGKCTWDNKNTYEGRWEFDRPHGKGIMKMPTGSVFIGDFRNGIMQGKGEYTSVDGTHYKGDMENNEFHGQGEEILENGEKYIGQFKNGLREGKGKLFFENTIFEGEFMKGFKHGHGTLTKADGTKITGEWKEDKLI